MRKLVIGILFLIVVAVAVILWRLEDHDLGGHRSVPLSFIAGNNSLSGTIWLPDSDPIAAVVLVHGDGPQDRSSDGYYAPLVNVLLEHRIAVASWDKPGVGASSGSWLEQSMEDRAREASAGLRALGLVDDLNGLPRGALGFSQAGWVLPKLDPKDANFLVLVGPAVSWERQGRFYTRRRLEREGKSEAAIQLALAQNVERDNLVFGANARFDQATAPEGMNRDRWEFVRRNRMADSTDELARLRQPVLAIWGLNDLNVDAVADAATYRSMLSVSPSANRILVVPNATHGLLKAGVYNYQLPSQWLFWARLSYLIEGRFAYAAGSLSAITGFIEQAATGRLAHRVRSTQNRGEVWNAQSRA